MTISQVCEPTYGQAGYEFCGYFPLVATVPLGQACSTSNLASGWVGSYYLPHDGPGTKSLTVTWTEFPSVASGPKRACLYVNTTGDQLVAVDADTLSIRSNVRRSS